MMYVVTFTDGMEGMGLNVDTAEEQTLDRLTIKTGKHNFH